MIDEFEQQFGFRKYSKILFEQSVTLTAKMWPQEDDDVENSVLHVWGLSIKHDYIPIIIGLIISAILILLLTTVYLLWRCILSTDKFKSHSITSLETIEKTVPPLPPLRSFSSTFSDFKNGNIGESRVIELIPAQECSPYWLYKNHYLGSPSQSYDGNRPQPHSIDTVESLKKSPKYNSGCLESSTPVISLDDCSLPQISEFATNPCQYLSSSILDDCYNKNTSLSNLKTRSLPSRTKKRPLSAVENPSEIYDKVNFSKKRKNRMRNDEAAIIALSKSRSQFLNKDTDVLVDNEAVIVYDERTAL